MTVFLATVQLIIIIIICIYEYNRKSVSIFLWAVSLIMFGIMHFLIVITGSNEYPSWVFNRASLFVIGFSSIYLLTRIFLLRNNQAIHINIGKDEITELRTKIFYDSIDKKFVKILLTLMITTIIYSLYIIIHASGGILNTSWASSYNYYLEQGYFSFSKAIVWLYFPCTSIFLIGLINKNNKLIIISSVLIVIYVVISRNKADLLPILCGIISYFIFKKGKLNFKNTIFLFFLGFVSIYIINAFQVFRCYGTISEFIRVISLIDFNNLIFDRIINGEGELSLLKVFYYFIYNNNNFPGFEKGHTYIRMLFVLLPTGLSFGIKPPDFAITMGSAWTLDFSNSTFSTHPTLFGDVYANLGCWGIFLGIFWAFLVYYLDKLIDRKNKFVKIALISIISCNYVLIGRGSVYNSYTTIIYGVIIIGCIYFISHFRVSKLKCR